MVIGVVTDVFVCDPVAERVACLGQPPGEHLSAICWVGDDGAVVAFKPRRCRTRRAVDAGQPILGADFPMVSALGVVSDLCKQALGARAVALDARVAVCGVGLDLDQILGAGEHESVLFIGRVVAVSRNTLRREPRHARKA